MPIHHHEEMHPPSIMVRIPLNVNCQLAIPFFGIMSADNLVRTMATEAKSTADMGKIDTVIGMLPSYVYNTN